MRMLQVYGQRKAHGNSTLIEVFAFIGDDNSPEFGNSRGRSALE
jgi:hypothetical protein